MKFADIIQNKKTFRVGFIGGSITEGFGSSAPENCFASKVTEGLAAKYPETDFTCINAGVGGTTSALGLFRLTKDLLSKKPDTVFIEFALNDFDLASPGVYMENLIRKIKQYDKNMPIVLLYTISMYRMLPQYLDGNPPKEVTINEKLAKYYGIPDLNIGISLYESCGKDQTEMATCFLPDGVHPNDKGYQNYADTILAALPALDFTEFDSDKPYLFEKEIKNPHFLMGNTMANDTWKLSDETMCRRLENYIYSTNAGDTLEIPFHGTVIGMFYGMYRDSGIMEYRIDGGEWKECPMWDSYSLRFNRAQFTVFDENLTDGNHVLTVRNSGRKEEQSSGITVRIGAFAIG